MTATTRRTAALAAIFVATVLSCGRDSTAPGNAPVRMARGLSFRPEFPPILAQAGGSASGIVAFTHVRVVLRHSDGTIALDTAVDFPANADEVTLSLNVALLATAPAAGEPMTLNLAYVSAAGDTVFRGGPAPLVAMPAAVGASAPPPVDVPLNYTGPGSNATGVKISPTTVSVVAGDPFALTAVAVDANGTTIPNTPITWTSLDPSIAALTSPGAGAGTTGPSRGAARIIASLLTGPNVQATVNVLPKASTLAAVSGSGQSGPGGLALAQPVVVKVTATDALPMAGVVISFVAANGGTATAPTATTDANGLAQTTWKLGASPGAQTLTASAAGLTGSPLTFTATATSGAATKLVVSTQPVDAVAGAPIAVVVTAQDANGSVAGGFTGAVSMAIGTNPKAGTLSGTTTVNAVAGVATFSTLSINKSGPGYTLVASGTSLTPATTGAFNIITGPATILTIVSGGGQTGAAGSALALPVVVGVTDALGNPVAGKTVTLAAGTGGGSVTPTTGVSDALGQVSTTWTLGATVGPQVLNATGTGLLPNPLAIGATATVAGVPGVPVAIVFAQNPTSVVAGVAIAPAITVQARDAFATLASTFTGNVTLAIGSNPGGAALGGTLTVAAVAGVATFNTISLNKSGSGYSLAAGSGALPPATSIPFNVLAGAASTLAISAGNNQTAPINAPLPTPLAVTITDALGNPVSGYTVNWAVASGGGTVAASSATNTAGVASMNWTLGAAVGAQSVTATAAGLAGSPATFNATATTVGIPSALTITTQPSATVAGVSIAPAIVVQARDAGNNPVPTYTGNVTIAIGTNPGASALGGTLTVAAVGGVATFSNVTLNHTGVGYTLVASAAGLSNATTTTFNVTPAAANHLAFTVQPVSTGAGVVLSPAVAVAAQDAFNNAVTTFTGNVTIAIGANPGGSTLSGTATVAAVGGVATFNNLSLTTLGVGYTLTAASAGLTGATSTTFDMTANTLSWTNPAGGSWSLASNWNLGRVPVTTDSVAITLAGTYTVTLDTTFAASFITVGGASGTQTLALSNRALTVSGALTLAANGAFAPLNSTVSGTGSIVNQGTLSPTNTTINTTLANQALALFAGTSNVTGAVTNPAGATLRVQGNGSAGASNLTVTNGFTNNGAIELTDIVSSYGANLTVTNGTLTNSATGTITGLVGTGGVRNLNAQLNNQGIVTAAGGSVFTLAKASAAQVNSGAINLSGGNFTLNQSGVSPSFTNSGTITIGPAQTFTISNGSFTYSSGAITGGGTLGLSGVTTNLTQSITNATIGLTLVSTTINGPGTLTNAVGQTQTIQAGTINAPFDNQGLLVFAATGTFAGAFTNDVGATLRVQGNGSVGQSTLTISNGFTNNGAIELTDIVSTYGAVLNVSSGTLTNSATGTITALAGTGGTRTLNAQLDNQGVVNASGGSAFTIGQASAAHTNSGTINISGTSLNLTQSGTSPSFTTTGAITIAPARTFAITNGAFSYASGALTGGGTLNLSGVTVNLTQSITNATIGLTLVSTTINGPGTLTNAVGQTQTIQAGTINAPFDNQGLLVFAATGTFAGAFTNDVGATLRVQGNGSVGQSTLTISNGFTNNGAIELTDIVSSYGAVLNVPTGTLTNSATGTITALAGTGGTRTLNAQLDNQGVVNASGGSAFTIGQASAAHINSGAINISGTSLNLTQSGTSPSFTTTGAITIAPARTFAITNGAFSYASGALTGGGTLNLSGVTVNLTQSITNATIGLTLVSTTINGPGTLTNAVGQTQTIQAGTINAPFDNQGLLVFAATGTFAGAFTNDVGATLRVQGNGSVGQSTLTISNGFTNNGAIELTDIVSTYGAVLNVSSGTLTNSATGTITALAGTGGTRTLNAQLDNQGVVNASGGSAFTIGQASAAHTNSGTINISGTSLNLTQSGTSPSFTTTGAITIAPARTFAITNGAFSYASGALTGGGTLNLSGVTVNLTQSITNATIGLTLVSTTINGPGTLTNAVGQTQTIQAGTINAPFDNQGLLVFAATGTFAGAFTNDVGATLRVQGNGSVGQSTLTISNGFTNNGAIELTDIVSSYGAVLNVPTGTLTNSATGTISALAGTGGTRTLNAQLDNQGVVNASGGSAFTIGQASAAHTNSGTINVTGSNLTVTQSGGSPSFTTTGTIAVSNGQTFTVTNGTFTHSSGTLSGAGNFSLSNVNATVGAGFTVAQFTTTGSIVTLNTALTTSGVALTVASTTINGSGSITNALGQTLNLNGGAVNVPLSNSGLIVVGGTQAVTGALTNAAGATLRVQGNGSVGLSTLTVANGFTNNGAIELTDVTSSYGATLNVASGTLVNSATGTITGLAGLGGVRNLNAQLNNQGVLTAAGGSGFNIGGASAAHTNSGTINVTGANLVLTQSGVSPTFTTTGTISVALGRSFTVNGGTFTHTSGSLSGNGHLAFSSAAATINAGFTMSFLDATATTLTVNTALSTSGVTLTLSGGTVNGTGSITNASGGTLSLTNTTIATPLTNNGQILYNGTGSFTGTFAQGSTGLLELAANGSTGNSSLTIANGFTNNGTIDLSSTVAGYPSSLTVTSGTLTNAALGTISTSLGAGGARTINAQINNLGTISVGQPLTMSRASSTHLNSGLIDVSAADLTITQSGVSPSFTNTGVISILNTRTMTVSGGTFIDSTGATINGAGTLAFNATATATLVNAITIPTLNVANSTVTLGAALSTATTTFGFSSSTINAPGITNALGQTLTLNHTTINAPVTNQGTLIASGTSAISGALTTAAGSLLRVGQVDGSISQATLTVANGFTNNGTIDLTVIVAIGYGSQLSVTSGTLTNAAGGTIISTDGAAAGGLRILAAAVNNLGTMTVQSGGSTTGRLNINGNFTTSGVLNLKLAGTTVVTQYDQVTVTGTATLGGTLNVSLANAFVPASTNTFTILTSTGARSGTFATNNLPGSITTPPTYAANSVTLVAP